MPKINNIKKLIGVISFVLFSGVLTSVGIITKSEVTIDIENFDSVVEYNSQVDYSSIIIVEDKVGKTERIPVEESMITRMDTTSSVGNKSMTIEYNKEKFTVTYTVKYKVEFIVDNEVVSKQMVLGRR